MITWFYSKLAIYLFCISVFIVLVIILYDFLSTQVFLRNACIGKYFMYLHFYKYLDQYDLLSNVSKGKIEMIIKVPKSNIEYVCNKIYCNISWKYLGKRNVITYLIPYYYNKSVKIYEKGQNFINISL